MEKNFCIELSKNLIRFDAVSQLTNVFFDDSNKQIFAVRSGGATGVVVKGPTEDKVISFCMPDRGTIRSIKFSPDNQILAVQRCENSVEFICFQGGQPNLQEIIVHQVKALIYGFVWVHNRECAFISNSGVEIFTVVVEKHQVKSLKAMSMSIKWFAWCSETNIAVLCTADNTGSLIPVLIKQKSITKLPKLDCSTNREVQESKVTLSQIYGVMAVLILQASTSAAGMEVEVYLLDGPGLAARKCHVLRLGLGGLFAINTLDNLIVVHHQASATSLIFDILLSNETKDGITYHSSTSAINGSIKPFALKLPSLIPDAQMLQCELYSTNWVLFQPNIVIDAKLGCMWYLNLDLEPSRPLFRDLLRLTDFLLQRNHGKLTLLKLIRKWIDIYWNIETLHIEPIFDKINKVYASWVQLELQSQTAQPSNVKTTSPKLPVPPRVLVEQIDMHAQVFQTIVDKPKCQTILLLYLKSLCKHNIAAQEDLSKMLINGLILSKSFDTLRRLAESSLLMESKAIACYLLSHSNEDPAVSQVALDMLTKIKAHDIIIEVLLGQGKVVDALRLAINTTEAGRISARKFLEAAKKTQNDMTFYSVYRYFEMCNVKQHGTMEFLKAEQCGEFVQYYNNLYKTIQS